jgi:RNA polymerase sigma-32 factor
LQLYLSEIQQYDLLTRDEEIALARRFRDAQDQEAMNRMVTSNLRLVVKIAMDFHRFWRKSLLDLIQEGNLGLIQAVQKYDPDRGVKLSYYASFWIKAYILKFIMDNTRLVKIGTTQNQRKLFFNLAKERNRLRAEGVGFEPKQIAQRLDVKEDEVVEMMQRLEGELSLNASMGEDGRETYESMLQDPDRPVDEQLSETQQQALFSKKLKEFRKRLPSREADIFDRRIMSEKPLILQELGERHQISRERVRQLQKKVVENIKAWSEEEIPNFQEEFAGT